MTTPSPSTPERSTGPQSSLPPPPENDYSPLHHGLGSRLLHRRPEDPIPIVMLAGIFAVVLAIIWILLWPNWSRDWNRYQSLKAQRQTDFPKAVKYLTTIINTPAEDKKGTTQILPKENPTLLSELGNAYYRMGQYDKALTNFLEAQKYGANLPVDDQGAKRPPADFSTQLGMTYAKLGNTTESERLLKKELSTNILNQHANFFMGEIEMKRGNYVKAADYFKVVSQSDLYKDQVKKYYAEIEQKLFADIK